MRWQEPSPLSNRAALVLLLSCINESFVQNSSIATLDGSPISPDCLHKLETLPEDASLLAIRRLVPSLPDISVPFSSKRLQGVFAAVNALSEGGRGACLIPILPRLLVQLEERNLQTAKGIRRLLLVSFSS